MHRTPEKKHFIINIVSKMADTPEKYSMINNFDVKCLELQKNIFLLTFCAKCLELQKICIINILCKIAETPKNILS